MTPTGLELVTPLAVAVTLPLPTPTRVRVHVVTCPVVVTGPATVKIEVLDDVTVGTDIPAEVVMEMEKVAGAPAVVLMQTEATFQLIEPVGGGGVTPSTVTPTLTRMVESSTAIAQTLVIPGETPRIRPVIESSLVTEATATLSERNRKV